jgi:hypothetical protein
MRPRLNEKLQGAPNFLSHYRGSSQQSGPASVQLKSKISDALARKRHRGGTENFVPLSGLAAINLPERRSGLVGLGNRIRCPDTRRRLRYSGSPATLRREQGQVLRLRTRRPMIAERSVTRRWNEPANFVRRREQRQHSQFNSVPQNGKFLFHLGVHPKT